MPDFTWGETVRVKAGAPRTIRPGACAAVCGISEVDKDTAKDFKAAIGSKVYLIEFGDGVSAEVPETWLELVEE